MNSRYGLMGICLALAALMIGVFQISPIEEGVSGANGEAAALPIPRLNSTEALAVWHGSPSAEPANNGQDSREALIRAWNAFCGKFSPLPNFDELPATFRLRSLAAGRGESSGFTIALCSDWDAETITDKLRPFRRRLSTLAAYLVDIDRLDNGVLVETHAIKPAGEIYVLRHSGWLIVTDNETNIPQLAQAALEQQEPQKAEISEATYSVLNEILIDYGIDDHGETADES